MLWVLFLLCGIQGNGLALTKVKLELKWKHQFQFAGFYMAKEKGFYRQHGLDVQILERNKKSSPLEDVLRGDVQFGISDSTIIKSYLLGKPVVLSLIHI